MLAAQSTNHSLNEPPTQFPPLAAAIDPPATAQEVKSLHANVSWHRKGGPREVEVSANSAVVITTISTRLEPIPKISTKIDVVCWKRAIVV
jgi:hypothetical protein